MTEVKIPLDGGPIECPDCGDEFDTVLKEQLAPYFRGLSVRCRNCRGNR